LRYPSTMISETNIDSLLVSAHCDEKGMIIDLTEEQR
jgi:hypothetical protein